MALDHEPSVRATGCGLGLCGGQHHAHPALLPRRLLGPDGAPAREVLVGTLALQRRPLVFYRVRLLLLKPDTMNVTEKIILLPWLVYP